MSEREVGFSQEEKEQIGFYARELAELGEDAIWEVVLGKMLLMKMTLGWQDSPELKALFPKREQMFHEADVMGEIVRQARTIRQFEGIDELSVLDRAAQEAGLGSVFDPESEIGKDMKDVLGR